MNIEGRHYRTIWPEGDGRRASSTRRGCRFAFAVQPPRDDGGCRGGDLDHDRARRAADRRDRRLRRRAGDARRTPPTPRSTRPCACSARRGRPRSTCAGRSSAWRRVLRPLRAGERAARAFARGGRDLPTRTSPCCRAIGEHGAALIREIAARKARRAGQHPHPLQRRLARDRRLGHGAGADLRRARRRHASSMSGSTRRGRATRARRSPPASSARTACRTRSIADNAGGHLMQHGQVDLCIVGTDRTTATGDVANKIGTYLKALAAHDNGVPFYVALPFSTIDWSLRDGVREIPIEERSAREVTHMTGRTDGGAIETVAVVAPGSPAAEPRLRRDAGAARHRPHHRARRRQGEPRGASRPLPGTGRRLMDEAALRETIVARRAGARPRRFLSLEIRQRVGAVRRRLPDHALRPALCGDAARRHRRDRSAGQAPRRRAPAVLGMALPHDDLQGARRMRRRSSTPTARWRRRCHAPAAASRPSTT